MLVSWATKWIYFSRPKITIFSNLWYKSGSVLKKRRQSYNQECGTGHHCTTDLEADWLPKGQMQWRMTRGCTRLAHPTMCLESHSPYYSYKECQVVCDPFSFGAGTVIENWFFGVQNIDVKTFGVKMCSPHKAPLIHDPFLNISAICVTNILVNFGLTNLYTHYMEFHFCVLRK